MIGTARNTLVWSVVVLILTVHFGPVPAGIVAPAPTVISIGPITSATAVEQGLSVSAEASESTIEGLVAALVSALTPLPL